jgi:large subunit ribosomal protein L7/L12
VESLEAGRSFPVAQQVDSDLTSQVVSLLGRGEKIEAVKLYRNKLGGGLKEAKEAVERIGAQNGIPSSSGSGCLGIFILLAIVAAGLSL